MAKTVVEQLKEHVADAFEPAWTCQRMAARRSDAHAPCVCARSSGEIQEHLEKQISTLRSEEFAGCMVKS